MTQQLSIIVEGELDAVVLRKLLPPNFAHARFFAAQGRSSVATVARNLLVHEEGPVMLVADADTHDVERLRQDRANLRLALSHVAPPERFDVFLFVPEIEAIFFDCDAAVAKLSASAGHDPIYPQYGKAMPKRALESLRLGQPFGTWLHNLDATIWDLLKEGEQVKGLLSALQSLVTRNRES